MSATAVRELVLLQQVHYFSPLLSKDEKKNTRKGVTLSPATPPSSSTSQNPSESTALTNGTVTCPYLTIVLGVARVSGEFSFPSRVRKSSSDARLHTDRTSTTNGANESENGESPRKFSRLDNEEDHDEDDGEEQELLNMISGGHDDDEDKGGRESSSALPSTRSFLVFPGVDRICLETLMPHIKSAAKLKAPWLPATFALGLCHDIYAAVHHMTSCGVVLKWLATDQIFINSAGHLVLSGLQGATLTGEPQVDGSMGGNATPIKTGGGHTSTDNLAGEGSDKKRKRDAETPAAGQPIPAPSLPYLHMSAPEIILGGSASVASSVFTAGMVCSHILAGKSPVKTGANEQKHLQYLYRTLGTPKKEGYRNFQDLPLAGVYGRHIINEGKEPAESRSRVVKVLKDILPAHVLAELSHPHATEETDKGHVLDVLRKSTALAPHRRTSPPGLLAMPLFVKNAGKIGMSERRAGLIALKAKLK